jgi:hypothetical protein
MEASFAGKRQSQLQLTMIRDFHFAPTGLTGLGAWKFIHFYVNWLRKSFWSS